MNGTRIDRHGWQDAWTWAKAQALLIASGTAASQNIDETALRSLCDEHAGILSLMAAGFASAYLACRGFNGPWDAGMSLRLAWKQAAEWEQACHATASGSAQPADRQRMLALLGHAMDAGPLHDEAA